MVLTALCRPRKPQHVNTVFKIRKTRMSRLSYSLDNCLTASQRTTAPVTWTLKERTNPLWGISTQSSTWEGFGRIGSEIKNHLIEKLDRDALPLLAKEEDGLGGEDEVLQGDALFCLLHRHNPPTIPDCEWCKRTMRRNCKN